MNDPLSFGLLTYLPCDENGVLIGSRMDYVPAFTDYMENIPMPSQEQIEQDARMGITRSKGGAGWSREGHYGVRGGGAISSDEVRRQTQGMYDVIHLMVYCPQFTGEMTYIENTILLLLMDLGWDLTEPRCGAVVFFMGDPEFVKAMSHVIVRRRLPHSSIQLPRDNEIAMEAMDHAIKGCTHAVEFCSRALMSRPMYPESVFSQMAWAAGVSYRKFALTL